jgi:antirestriction protein ArdC
MDKQKQQQCRRFFSSAVLPDMPTVVVASYCPVDNVVYLPIEEKDNPTLYYRLLTHEYFHKQLFHCDLRQFVEVNGDDFWALEELVVEVCCSVVFYRNLGIYDEVKQLDYIRNWKNKLSPDKSLLSKVYPIAQIILRSVLGYEIKKEDVPVDLRIVLGLF